MHSVDDGSPELRAASVAGVDVKLAQVVELRYFAGLSEQEIAELMKRSERSIRRDWQKARMFLLASLGGEDGER